MTTVGYGDIAATTPYETLASLVGMVRRAGPGPRLTDSCAQALHGHTRLAHSTAQHSRDFPFAVPPVHASNTQTNGILGTSW